METMIERNLFKKESEVIVEAICSFLGRDKATIYSETRGNKLTAEARFICFYFVRKFVFPVSVVKVGFFFKRDHSSIVYGLKRIEAMKNESKIFVQELSLIEEEVKRALADNQQKAKQKKTFIKRTNAQ